jgi:hypothetical protein
MTTWVTTSAGPGSSGITISPDGLTATCISGLSSPTQVISDSTYSTGTTSAQFVYSGNTSDYCAIGVIQNGYNDPNGLHGDYSLGGAAIYVDGSQVAINDLGSPVATFAQINAGDVITIIINLDAKLFWYQINNGLYNSSSAAPTTSPSATASSSGGYDISSLTFPMNWCVSWQTTSQVDSVTAAFDIPFNDVENFGGRVSFESLELLGTNDGNARISYETIEGLGTNAATARISYDSLEGLGTSNANARIDQVIMMILTPSYIQTGSGPASIMIIS